MLVAWRVALWVPVAVCAHELLVGVVPAAPATASAAGAPGARALVVLRRARIARGTLVLYPSDRGGAALAARVRGVPGDVVVSDDGARLLESGELWVVSERASGGAKGNGGGGDDDGDAEDSSAFGPLPRALVLGVPVAALSERSAAWLPGAELGDLA